MKLYRLTRLHEGRPSVPRHYGSDPFGSGSFYVGKVYGAQEVEEYGGYWIESYEHVCDLPDAEPPRNLGEVRPFCQRWIEFALSDVAGDLGRPADIFGPVLEALREAVEAMPDAPTLPERNATLSFANQLRQWRDWAPQAAAEATKQPEDKSGGQTTSPDISLDARAVGVYVEHPDWTKKRIAESLECNEKSLCPDRCPKLAAAIRAHRAPDRKARRGSKDRDGNVEAWDEE